MAHTRLEILFGLVLIFQTVALAQPSSAQEWQLVDSLAKGRPIVLTLNNGEIRSYRFLRSSPQDLTLQSLGGGLEEVVPKQQVVKVVSARDAGKAAKTGALIGGGAFLAWIQGVSDLCREGCENDMPAGAGLAAGGIGAGIGSLLGYALSRTSGAPEILFPRPAPDSMHDRYPSVRIRTVVGRGTFRSYELSGPTTMASAVADIRMSPRMSLQIELTKPSPAIFFNERALLHDQVISGALPANTIRRQEQHSVRVPYRVAGLVGYHFPAWGPLKVGMFAGLSLHSKEETDISPNERSLRKYQSPGTDVPVGVEAEFAATSRVAVVSRLRYDGSFGVQPSVGLAWRIR